MNPNKPPVEKTILSLDGQYRAEITRRPSGGFQVTVYKWFVEHAPGYGKLGEGWERVRGQQLTVADTLETAEALAEEALRNVFE